MDDYYAFGASHCRRVDCPSRSAGKEPGIPGHNDYARIAGQYDTYASLALFELAGGDVDDLNGAAIQQDLRNRGYASGKIPEWLAKQCWLDAIEAQDTNAAKAGREVASRLNWR